MSHQSAEIKENPGVRTQDDRDVLAEFRTFRQTRDAALRDQLIQEHLHLASSVARRFIGLGESIDDLVQEGTIGLLNAIDLFDPDRGVKFSTYACHLIVGQIQHYLRDRGRLIRQPAWVQELNTRVSRISEQLTQELGREPSPEEVAERLEMSVDTVQNVIAARELNRVMSLSMPTDNSSESDLPVIEKDRGLSMKLAALNLPVEERMVLDEAINSLKEMERRVVRLFFFGDLNQSEIARKLGISVNYSSYLLRRSTTKIKQYLEEQQKKQNELFGKEQERPPVSETVQNLRHQQLGVFAGEYLRARVAEEIERSKRYPTNFALMFVSIQGLPNHEEERLTRLKTLAGYLTNSIRSVDQLGFDDKGRFVLLLPHTGREARVLGERLCRRMRSQLGSAESSVHLNAGFAVFPLDGVSSMMLYDRAEQALRSAIKAGPGAVACISTVWPASDR